MDKVASEMKLSIIVPIYGVEKYLRQCLDSIAAQTFKDFECILIDDGSKDGCPAICDEYVVKDNRFKVVHKENAGYGAAVNTGLDLAQGEWIGIVEPDDWIVPKMYAELLEYAEDCVDVVKGNYKSFLGDVVRPNPYRVTHRMTGSSFRLEECPQFLYWHPSIWTCIYRRSFLCKHHIRMIEPPGAAWNDNPWQVQTLFLAKGIKFVDKEVYCYRNHCAHAYEELKDYRIPICRDSESLLWLNSQTTCSGKILAAFYNRIWTHLAIVSLVAKWHQMFDLHKELMSLFAQFDGMILNTEDVFDNERVRQDLISWRENIWLHILRVHFAPKRMIGKVTGRLFKCDMSL